MKISLLLIAGLLCAPALGAEKLRDPTRPLATPQRAGAAATPATPAAPKAAPVLPVLQLVLMGAERRYAVIDGELLAEGDDIRGLTVQKILDDAVVLITPNGPRTLPLSVEP
jgi:hypothetical protein